MIKLHHYHGTGDWCSDTVNGHFYVVSRGGVGYNIHKDGDYCFAEGYAETLKDARKVIEEIMKEDA